MVDGSNQHLAPSLPETEENPSAIHHKYPNDSKPLQEVAAASSIVAMLPLAPGQASTYHPDFLFCGECTTCQVHPETSNENLPEDLVITDKLGSKVVEETQERTKLTLDTFNCPSQVLILQSLLLPLPGVTKVLPNLDEHMLVIDHGPESTVHQLQLHLKDAGFPNRLSHVPSTSPEEYNHVVRSALYVGGICCASECPAVKKILKPLPGVSKIQINITTKAVYVHHDTSLITAQVCADALNLEGFNAKVTRDGQVAQSALQGTVGRTTLHADNVLHNKDIGKIQKLLETESGIKRIGVNVAECVVYVEHDTTEISATAIAGVLTENEYPTKISTDAVDDIQERNTSALQVARSKYVESTLILSNLSLAHIRLIEKSFTQNYIRAQVRAFYPHVPSHTIKVEHNPTLLNIKTVCEGLSRYGFEATVAVDGAVEGLCLPLMEDYVSESDNYGGNGSFGSRAGSAGGGMNEPSKYIHWNVIGSGLFWVISLLSVIGGKWEKLEYAGIFSVLLGLPPIIGKAWRTLKRCQFDANCMMVSAALGALALQEYDEAASVAFLFAVSEYLEARATAKARIALGAIISLRPDHANVIHPVSKEIVVVPAEKVPIGSLISVRTGDKIAADGIVVEGISSVDESSLTGEALPMTKRPNDTVNGGSINIGSTQLVVKTTSTVEDSAVSRLIRLVEEAQANRSPTEKLIDSFARTYTPVVVLLAGLMCTVPWYFGEETGRYWTLNGLIIIVIACPCALTISTPVTYAAGLAAAAQRGVIVKGGARLEALGSVEKVVFDKTGTLTQGKFKVIHLETVGDQMPRKDVLEMLALMEAPSSHPLSATLVNAAKMEGITIPKDARVEQHTILKGQGVTATVNGKKVYVGNTRLFTEVNMMDTLPPKHKAATQEWNKMGGTVGFLGIEGQGIVGAFCVDDAVRDEARDVITSLKEGGIQVVMLTGDGDGAAKAVGQRVGIPENCIFSQLLPEDKLHHIGGMKTPANNTSCPTCATKSLVLMCGDGVNDAPALAVADVGVAMGEGAALAMEMSDITLMDSNLMKLLYTIKMGARVIVTIQENIMLSVLAKLLVVGLTFAGKMTLLSAIAADVGVMLIVTLNGMKLLPGRKEKKMSMNKPQAIKRHVAYKELPLDGKPVKASTTNNREIEIV
mmetsp:Transcript_17193/g.26613  ORF Transcript_17193/g.26613 Transcript_17193/m.26613 type:complete len:1152 (+) Transcript_17193:114-3569(+)|eukprot:CAMPEP_0195300104 /NCGR_PEP_ID=MMETSP0707-20130614/26737_1 /TAXON_ID=33640 /ORGANISM="Asterionellopsis glacialis, Strain CCMP134" /LENGTH=1151 /DNA_ID=CAMNT_0040362685 /DNA_START=74 /DNA_END=3529 /DNA_ORIENTATION=+